MLASEVPRDQWAIFFEHFNRQHSGDRHRIGIVVGEPLEHQETFLMTDPQLLVWSEEESIHTLQSHGTDGRSLVVRLIAQVKAAA